MNLQAQNKIWILLANTEHARVYCLTPNECTLVKFLDHPQSRAKNSDLVSDRPGHYKTSHIARGEYMPRSIPHKHEHDKFAQVLSKFLERSYKDKIFHKIIICMEPYFLGLVNKHMIPVVRDSIIKTISKDYIPLSAVKLKAVLNSIKIKYGPKVMTVAF